MKNADKPAYPVPYQNRDGSIQHDVYFGLTKRERIAAMAMQGLLTRVPQRAHDEMNLGTTEALRIAEESVVMADLLLNQLETE